MQRTGYLAIAVALVTLSLTPQASAAIGVGAPQRAIASEVHQATFDRLLERKHKKLKHYKHHKKHKKHKHKKHHH